MPPEESSKPLREITRLFLKLGFTAFGGPAAHIAMFRDETVNRRRWLTDEEFLDLLGVTNLIPGPNSTEMAIHLGYMRGRWRGLLLAGLCFIMPAVLIVLILAWLYVEYGTTPTAESLLYGIKPVIIAVILQALWGLTGKAAKTPLLIAIGIAVFALYLAGVNEIALLFAGGFAVLFIQNAHRLKNITSLAGIGLSSSWLAGAAENSVASVSLIQLFLVFLKIGAVLYGSGYVLLAFMRGDLVERLGWLTEQQLLDAIAIGQFTPGPVFTTATFVGYVVAGLPGAIVATIGIFLPSFLFVALTHPLIPYMRRSQWFGALLDGVNIAALGLMAGVTLQLGIAAIVDWFTAVLALASAILLIGYKVNSTWIILGGAILGIIYHRI